MSKVYIVVEGGTVTDVLSDNSEIEVLLVDHDVLDEYYYEDEEVAEEIPEQFREMHDHLHKMQKAEQFGEIKSLYF